VNAGVVAHAERPRLPSISSAVEATTPIVPIVIGLTAVAAVLRFVGIGHQSYWYDEAYTVNLVHHSVGRMLGLLPRTELTPPLYYCVAWVWARIFGFGEAGLRSLSAVAGVATIPAIYGVGAKLISKRAGLVAAALACFNPLLVWYSQEARSYSLLVLTATLSLLAFAYAREPRPAARRLVFWVLAAGLTLATHYYAVLVVVPEALWLLWVHRRDFRVWIAVAAAAAIGGALLPVAISQRPHASWIARWPLDRRLGQVAPQFLLGTGSPAHTILLVVGALAVLLAVALLAWRADRTERRGALLAGGIALAGLLIALGLVASGVDELITRNIILVLIPLIVLIAGGLGARRAGRLGTIGAGVLCAVGLVAVIGVLSDQYLQRPDWRAAARAIGPRRPPGAGRAILLQQYPWLLQLQVQMPGLQFMSKQGGRVDEVDVVSVPPPHTGWFCWWGSTCNVKASHVDTAIRIRGFDATGPVLHAGQFLIFRLRSPSPVRLTRSMVSRGLTATPIVWDGLLYQPGK
jgi:mannosyltransferase